jgi:hypothetical protein
MVPVTVKVKRAEMESAFGGTALGEYCVNRV